MDEARQVLNRLDRIEALRRRLNEELRALAPEAERWARAENDDRAAAAARRLAAEIERAHVPP